MSRISELGFYNDKDVITQIEWLKNNIKANHIESVQVEQITEKDSEDYGLTTVKITMENGQTHEGKFTSAILKDVRIEGGEGFKTMVFELANGERLNVNIPESETYWVQIKGDPHTNTALKQWMDEKAEAVDLTDETNLRARSDEALGQRITDLDRDVAGEIGRIDGELADKADKSALEEETAKRTEADTGLLQAITAEETARKSADDGIYGRITELNKDLDDETAKRTNSDTGLLQAITAEENARKSLTDTYHKNQITPITPPDFEFSGIAEFGNGLTNTIEIVFNKVSSLSAATKIGHTDFKPVAQVDLPVRSAYNGEIGGFIGTSGDIFIWSSYGHQIVASLGGIVVTYVVRRS